jgi:ribosomal protein S8
MSLWCNEKCVNFFLMYLLADMFSRIRVAINRHIKNIIILNSKLCRFGLMIIKNLGYIIDYQVLNFKYLKINLKYFLGRSVLRLFMVLSRPSNRYYANVKKLKNMFYNNKIAVNGFIICSTSKYGLMTELECLISNTGGEVLFFIG